MLRICEILGLFLGLGAYSVLSRKLKYEPVILSLSELWCLVSGYEKCLRYEALTAMKMLIMVSLVVTLCVPVGFGTTYHLHLQGDVS